MTCTAARFRAWLFTAAPGERFEYHRGSLARDRSPEASWSAERRRELNELAHAVIEAAGRGHVHLVQHRNGELDFSYVAIKAASASSREGIRDAA